MACHVLFVKANGQPLWMAMPRRERRLTEPRNPAESGEVAGQKPQAPSELQREQCRRRLERGTFRSIAMAVRLRLAALRRIFVVVVHCDLGKKWLLYIACAAAAATAMSAGLCRYAVCRVMNWGRHGARPGQQTRLKAVVAGA